MAKKRKSVAGHCLKCGIFREALHRDHIIPKWNGGEDEESNVQYICSNCHDDKTRAEHRTPEYRAGRRQEQRKRWENPQEHVKASLKMLERYEDPAEREKARVRGVQHYENNPDAREKQRKAQLKSYEEDPTRRERQIASHLKRYKENPGAREVQRLGGLKRYSDPAARQKSSDDQLRSWR